MTVHRLPEGPERDRQREEFRRTVRGPELPGGVRFARGVLYALVFMLPLYAAAVWLVYLWVFAR